MIVDSISLEVFRNQLASIVEEMGIVLGRTAYSPNIKERLDYSCAVFDAAGRSVAQAEHIPVHLGAMAASVRAGIDRFAGTFTRGDLIILNDPFLGGTHLPDVTLISPVFATDGPLIGFAASRAHHADVGGISPGSMPVSTEIYQEGFIIPPLRLVREGRVNEEVLDLFFRNVRTPDERQGDLAAQMAANRIGEARLRDTAARYGPDEFNEHVDSLISYGEGMVRSALQEVSPGTYRFRDQMETPPGTDSRPVIEVAITIDGQGTMTVDFEGTSPEVTDGNINAVEAVTVSAVLYCVRCLAGPRAPGNEGVSTPVTVIAPDGSLVRANPPRAVAAGNVETSQRIVDVVLGALAKALPGRIPAASQGTMNNVTIGGDDPRTGMPFAYYETLAGGAGGGPKGPGGSAVHTHMTNTMNTPVEALEYAYPFRVVEYRILRGSGGEGLNFGGDGLVRSVEFRGQAMVTVLSERRSMKPQGLDGGRPGSSGRNYLRRTKDSEIEEIPATASVRVEPGDVLTVETPGGGGWGSPAPEGPAIP
jgi:N-methylhydantoinase B